MEPIRQQLPADLTQDDANALFQAITQEAQNRFSAFLTGVRHYQTHPESREEPSEVKVVWQQGTTRLLDYAPTSGGPLILVIPSLVNRFEILDIDPDHSFLRFLAKQGFRPLVIDWQEPGEEEKAFTLSDYVTKRLIPALDEATRIAGVQRCHVLGYCMGGLMALGLTLLKKGPVASLTLLATPWDFAPKGVGGVPAAATVMGGLFMKQAQLWEPYLKQLGYMPAAVLQSVFTTFQSLKVLEKFTRFGTKPLNPEEARRFVLTEDWLNNGVPLALPVAMECLHDWYEKNLTGAMQWSLAGKRIDPRDVDVPTYLLIPQRDAIVPPESALPLASLIKNATLHEPAMGHIGVMTGDKAPEKAWKNYVSWLWAQ